MPVRPNPENIAARDSIQWIHQRLENFALTNDLTRELESKGPEVIRSVLALYDVTLDDLKLIPTYFFLETQKAAVTKILGDRIFVDSTGVYAIELGLVGILIEGNDVGLISRYFHEHLHSLGRKLVVDNGNRKTIRTGYDHEVFSEDTHLRRGSFLEEAVVDWLATKMTVAFLKTRGDEFLEIDTQLVAEQKDNELYYRIVAALHAVASASPNLLPLFVQARFQPEKIGSLTRELKRHYGPGAAKTLFELPLDEDLVYFSVNSLVENR